MARINILHVLDSMSVGGLENGVVGLINRMNPERFQHALCCVRRSGASADRLSDPSVPIFEMGKRDGKDFLLPLRLARLIRRVGVDIVHTRNWGAIDGILGARLAGVRAIVHGEHGRDMIDPGGRLLRRNLFRRATARWVSRYITVSEDLRRWLTGVVGIAPEKVQTIINGVDTERFHPNGKPGARADYGLAPHQVVIGTVGRLDPVKDQQLLLRAFAELKDRHRDLVLLIVGDGPCREALEALSRDLELGEQCRFLGLRRDVAEIYRLLNVFVLPSIAEGISNTILEAMASGLPVVATAVGGNQELVMPGETGTLAPSQNAQALAAAIERYVESPSLRAEQGAAGRRRALQVFDLPRMVSQYEAAYLQALGHRS